jgi:hypothetical protein
MNLLQLPRCILGLHQRDRRHARYDGPVVRSRCTGCGRPMVKDGLDWHLDTPSAARTPAAGE